MWQCAERKKMGVLTTGYLMVNSWTDWRRKEVDIVWTVAVFVLTAFIYVGTDQKLCAEAILRNPGGGRSFKAYLERQKIKQHVLF